MLVKIKVTKKKDAEVWHSDRFTAVCEFPRVEAESSERARVINHVIGSVLHALGQWRVPPRDIKFQIKEQRK